MMPDKRSIPKKEIIIVIKIDEKSKIRFEADLCFILSTSLKIWNVGNLDTGAYSRFIEYAPITVCRQKIAPIEYYICPMPADFPHLERERLAH